MKLISVINGNLNNCIWFIKHPFSDSHAWKKGWNALSNRFPTVIMYAVSMVFGETDVQDVNRNCTIYGF